MGKAYPLSAVTLHCLSHSVTELLQRPSHVAATWIAQCLVSQPDVFRNSSKWSCQRDEHESHGRLGRGRSAALGNEQRWLRRWVETGDDGPRRRATMSDWMKDWTSENHPFQLPSKPWKLESMKRYL